MEELGYRDYLLIFRRHWLMAAVCALIGTGLGYVAARVQNPRPVYSAFATARWDPHGAYSLAPGATSSAPDMQLQLVLARSLTVLGNTAKRLKLIPADVAPEDYPKYVRVLIGLGSRINISADPAAKSGVMRFQAYGRQPEDAADTANALLEEYRASNVAKLRGNVTRRKAFIEKQLEEIQLRLRDAQLAYERYRREHPLAAYESAIAFMAAREAAASQISGKVQETRRQLDLVQSGRPISDLGLQAIVGSSSNARLTQLSTTYTQLTLERDRLLLELTEAHPLVQQKRQQLEAVRRNLQEELELILEAFERERAEEMAKLDAVHAHEAELPEEAMQLAQLSRDVKVQENLSLQLWTQLQDVLIKDAAVTSEVTIISAATPLPFAINPTAYARLMGLGGALGLFIGLIVAVLIESSRFTRQTLNEIETSLDLSVLAVAPAVTAAQMRAWVPGGEKLEEGSAKWARVQALPTLLAPTSPTAEAYRTLRASLLGKMSPDRKCFTLTASVPDEGITTAAVNLALSFAQAGQRVLLVESDFRNPAVSDLLGLVREPGMADWLLGGCTAQEATRTFADFVTGLLSMDEVLLGPGMDHLSVMPCGHLATTTEQLLGSDALRSKLAELQQGYDLVLFDCPPLATSADAVVLGRWTEVIVVYDPERAERADLAATVSQLRKAECTVTGLFVSRMEVAVEAGEPEGKPAVAAAG